MTNLTDLQSLLLASAASRDSGSLLPLPTTIKTPAAGVARSMASLIVKALAEEREVTGATPVHRSDGDLRFGLFITAVGKQAIGVVEEEGEQGGTVESAPVAAPERTNKSAAVLALLQRADLVRHIFARYLILGNARLLEAELKEQGIKVPVRMTATGKPIGGGWFSRGLLHVMLRRATYDGQIAHGDKVYVGNHPAIIDRDVFARVQAMLAEHMQGERKGTRATSPSLLAGGIVDASGEPLTPTHATKGTTRYRYYVSRSLNLKEGPGIRVPAREIEKLVATRIAELIDDPIELIATAWLEVPADRLELLHQRSFELAGKLRGLNRETVTALVHQVRVGEQEVEVDCRIPAIGDQLDARVHPDAPEIITLRSDVMLTRSGMAVKLVHTDGCGVGTTPQAALTKQLVAARRWWAELRRGEIDITRLAQREEVTASYMTRIVRLAFLSPAVTEAMLAGRQRAGVDVGKLTQGLALPPLWCEQQRMLLP